MACCVRRQSRGGAEFKLQPLVPLGVVGAGNLGVQLAASFIV